MVPLFPLAARLRCEPDLHHEAVAILDGNGNTAYVVAASRKARRAGVKPGMTLTQARARCPKLIARARDEESEGTAREVLLEIAESFSPRVEEPDGEQEPFGGVIYLDLDGLERHYQRRRSTTGTAQNEPDGIAEFRLGRTLMRRLDDAGLPAKVGIASSKLAARVAAGLAKTAAPPPDTPGEVVDAAKAHARIEPQVVPPGAESEYLAPLPLHRLSPAGETADTLERWGIESVGDFAAISKSEVRSRLGELGHRLHLIARGIDPRPLIPRAPNHAMREGMTLEWPITHLEPFLFVAQAALERLCHRLERRGLGCKRLEMSLQLEPDGFHERSIELPAPSREAKTLLTLVRLDLESRTPGAPIVRFQFTAHPDAPRLAQLSLFGPASLSPDRLATTIARLFALLGPSRVGSPRPAPGHAPERFALVEYTPPPPPKIRRRVEPGRGLLAIRSLRPPVPLRVVTEAEEVAESGAEDHDHAGSAWSSQPIHPDAPPSLRHPQGAADPADAQTNPAARSSGSQPPDPAATLKAAMVRESDSGLSRSAQSRQLAELRGDASSGVPHTADSTPDRFSPEAEGIERQVGLFRASGRCAARPLHVCSDVATKQVLGAPPEGSAGAANAQTPRGERHTVPIHPRRPGSGDRSPKPDRTMRIEGDVRIASGPWELEEKWWLEERTERDYWDIELHDGTLYRIYRDRTNGRWFADGVYD